MTRVLMCSSNYFGVEYEINPWMHRDEPPVLARAGEQWRALRQVLVESAGATVLEITPHPGLPDFVFTANAGLAIGDTFVASRFRFAQRQKEEAYFHQWFAEHGYRVITLPGDLYFEGEGDAFPVGGNLFAGYHFRSDIRSHHAVADLFELRALSLHLRDPRFYHLDTCFCPLDERTLAYYPPAFDAYACQVIEAHFPARIVVSEEEALRFACNAVVIGTHVVLNGGCPRFEQDLREYGFQPHSVDVNEFLKAGGAAKCMTLLLR
ncbi:MAG TPA: arginine deiminase-related protein [Armatimonadota bacterium]|nr:arginine deiminase-related protein [Armatimonadota bacterium]